MILSALVVLATTAATPPAPDTRLEFLNAMGAELQRNQSQLRLAEHQAPYFISYQVKDGENHELAARYGAVFESDSTRGRQVYVDVRVGDYQFDNSGDDGDDISFSTK